MGVLQRLLSTDSSINSCPECGQYTMPAENRCPDCIDSFDE